MQAIIEPGPLNGTITVPASKSMMQRACAGALLHNGRTIINHPGTSEDDKAAVTIIQQLGAKIIERTKDRIIIESPGRIGDAVRINCGESGLAARLFTPIAALSDREITIEGMGSLLRRPMDGFREILPQLGVMVTGFNGYLPLTIKGPLKPAPVKIDGSPGSQFLTGVLFAGTAAAERPFTIEVTGLKSRPYIDLTLQTLQQFGKPVTHEQYTRFHIDPGTFIRKEVVTIDVEGDWSSAACWLVGAAINGNIRIGYLDTASLQADRSILEVLKDTGCEITCENEQLSVKRKDLKPFHFDATDSPDLFPVLAVLAAYCGGESGITGLHRLKHKESDRARSIVEMLRQLGVPCRIAEDTLFITGGQQVNSAVIDSLNDHRIVMAAAMASLKAAGRITINNARAVGKSYPEFFDHLTSLGAHCSLKH